MNGLLNIIEECCDSLNIFSFRENALRIKKFIAQNNIDIVILGQFKAGKSSFLNHFIGRDILPTGVIPVTSVITCLQFGETEKAVITAFNNIKTEININRIDEFIAENKNPKNEKNISIVDLELPELKQFQNVRLIDTPGIGSAFHHNTETTEQWFTEIGIAIVTISAERPLGENEIALIHEISKHTPEVVILLTKVDLYSREQIHEIREYIKTQLQKEFGKKFKLYTFTIVNNQENYKQTILKELIHPILLSLKNEHEKIAAHKINSLAESCLTYLNIAYKSSLKSEEDKEQLKKLIFDEKINTNFIQQELQLITESSKSRTREAVYKILEKHKLSLVTELQALFCVEYSSWNFNLFKLSRKYEEWLKKSLSGKLKEIANKEQSEFINILNGINAHFIFYTKSLRAKLSENINAVLGIKLTEEEWKPEFKPMKQPDISVYRAFDTPIDLLWFLFPMFLFKKIFRKYFLKQIAYEVDKNIYRLTSGINEIISKATDSSKEETIKYILNELNTVENALSGEQNKSNEYQIFADKLSPYVNNYRL